MNNAPCKALDSLREWIKKSETVKTAILYGSRESDTDLMLWLTKPFNPNLIWPCNTSIGGEVGFLSIVGEEFFDLSINPVKEVVGYKMHEGRVQKLGEMLMNSNPPPEWLKDELNMKDVFAAVTTRKQMTTEEILNTARQIYVNAKFVSRKIWSGPIHGRFILGRSLEPLLLMLAREVELRRGGKGFVKGKHVEKNFTPAEIEMLTIDYTLDAAELAEAIIKIRIQTRYWLKMLNIPVPYYLQKPW